MSIKLSDIKQKKKIGDILVEKGLVSADELKTALNLQKESREKIGRILCELGYISEKDLLQELSLQLEIPILIPEMIPPVPVIENTFSINFMKFNRFLPVHFEGGLLSIACVYPNDYALVNTIRQLTQHEIKTYLAVESEIMDLIDRLYGGAASDMERIIEGIGDGEMAGLEDVEDIEHLKDLASEAPVIRLVNLFLQKAVESRSSDIHVEPFEKEFKVRFRIDGILHDIESPPKHLKAAIISRIKLMAKLNIAERRLPQDGRIKLRVLGKEIDLRVSTLPTLFGESVVLRILDKGSAAHYDLAKLGFLSDTMNAIHTIIRRPYGMFLVTGPTGSGKSTTLYGSLKKINLPDKKIITIEDPVEYQIEGVNQIHVNPQIGLTFASGLRHIVRQDPDVIMVGEIRDLETAEIAIRAALTGHLVFSTLHTNDAPGAIARLIDMGAEDYLLASSILGILAQRLVRVICDECKQPVRPESALLKQFNFPNDTMFFEGKGCPSCAGTGYHGRIGIFELMNMTEEVKHLTISRSPASEIRKMAIQQGMRTLQEDGFLKVSRGMTTLAEVLRVTQDV
ncbi:MAG TPA: type II secretion system ATPase GspE [Acidobacteriota bacterium]|nr:type II secretion system ATPase GspE [Acidobacteriota bacterium]HNT99492.1 type II secretion system ATPase GspE [Acidobacteriota bacterium]HPB28454.1 type II secretion system ATPase GspE [Acidobacteriota bacterium]HQO26403.1 type II secretion system ATPase GspE [Acidobacteriota bacterium]HQP73789.1 type II secretion system ATPase GspE [Acidobacteriota bacterium]